MHTAPSYWEQQTWLRPADVAIVGAGLLGLWTAYELKRQRPHWRIVLLERAPYAQGASARNAGFACFGSPSEMLYDSRLNGEDAMLQVVEQRYAGIGKLRRVLGDDAIGFDHSGGYECYPDAPAEWDEKIAGLNKLLQPIMGTPQAFVPAHAQLPAMGMHGFGAMVANRLEAGIDSGAMVAALSKLVQQLGVQVLYGAEVLAKEPAADHWQLRTPNWQLRASQVLLATNAWLHHMAPTLGVVPARGQVLVSKPLPGLALQGTFHFDEGYYYWRHLPGQRLLLGGARNADVAGEQTLEMTTSAPIQQALEAFLIRHFPQYFTPQNIVVQIEYRWAGLMAMHPQKTPVLTQIAPGLWAAMCCNGMGVALAPRFAETVASAILTN
ncbi:MAG: FAD-binding oxidoreductase [Chitinophagaceae bacterium]|nr:FAD-binding oxidoreductase [Chitinophagaceae bacterium]